jgi:endonuclease/exonuclease/phosphatase family metal-dependent hydrolase
VKREKDTTMSSRSIVLSNGKRISKDDAQEFIAEYVVTHNGNELSPREFDKVLLAFAAFHSLGDAVTAASDSDGYEWEGKILTSPDQFKMAYMSRPGGRRQKLVIYPRSPVQIPGNNETIEESTDGNASHDAEASEAGNGDGSSGHGHYKAKVTTYNVFTGPAPGMPETQPSLYETDAYHASGKAALWRNRKHLVAAAIKDADIVTLNECTRAMFNDLRVSVPHLHEAILAVKPHEYDGSGILYNPLVFETPRQQDVHVKVLTPGNPQLAVSVDFKFKNGGPSLRVVTLHLKSGYGEQEQRRIREFTSASSLFGPPGDNLVVTGDFNSDYLAQYARLVDNVAMAKYGLGNAAVQAGAETTPTYTFYHQSVFDYILFRGNVTVSNYSVPKVGVHEQTPNARHGSDHLPVSVEVHVQ